jgi:hypothetical protein
MKRLGVVLAAAIAFAAISVRAQTSSCDGRTDQRVAQETYLALTDRVYVYVPDIRSRGATGGWEAFTVRLFSGMYRKPLLLSKAYLKERDLDSLLSTRRDIKTVPLGVPAFDAKSGKAPALTNSASIANGERGGAITVRVTRVFPASGGTDSLTIVCSTAK